MRRLKLEALEKGLATDYSFLVGTDKDATPEVSLGLPSSQRFSEATLKL